MNRELTVVLRKLIYGRMIAALGTLHQVARLIAGFGQAVTIAGDDFATALSMAT
jgi:hypothetical protein